ncbi:type II toxin-antitoxin system RelE/ParE family toxin [Actinoplanes derwentensis]
MGDRYDVELEPEVRRWLDSLPLPAYRTVEFHADRLAEAPTTLGEPYSKHLQGAVRELRFHLGRVAWRVTYWGCASASDRVADGLPQDPCSGDERGRACHRRAEGV